MIERPETRLDWLNGNPDPNYIMEPDTGIKFSGFEPRQGFTAEHFNWQLKNISDWQNFQAATAPHVICTDSLADAIKDLPTDESQKWVWVESLVDIETVTITQPNITIDFSPRFIRRIDGNFVRHPIIRIQARNIVIRNGIFIWSGGTTESNITIESALQGAENNAVVINTIIFNGKFQNITYNIGRELTTTA